MSTWRVLYDTEYHEGRIIFTDNLGRETLLPRSFISRNGALECVEELERQDRKVRGLE